MANANAGSVKPFDQKFLGMAAAWSLRGDRGLGCWFFAITLVESVDAARRIDELLLPGEEGVASRTDFHVQVALLGGASLEGLAASAGNGYFGVFRMNSWFHLLLSLHSGAQAPSTNKP